MIIQICDICNKEVKQLNTIVMYKQPIEYCDKCKEKVQKKLKEFENEVKFQRELMNASLRKKEMNLMKSLQKSIDKKVKK